MTVAETAHEAEARDPDVLSLEQAVEELRGAPWRRLAVLGDSIAAGVREPVPGYRDLSWIDRVVEAMERVQPGFEQVNLARRDVVSAVVRDEQLPRALAARPDLALICCGGNDLLRPGFDPDVLAATLLEIARPLQDAGAQVALTGMLDICASDVIPEEWRGSLRERLDVLYDATRGVVAELRCGFVDSHRHPASADGGLYASDRMHANARGHAIAGAVAIRELGRLARG